MKIKSSIIVATAAGSAFAPNAQAADLPVKAPQMTAAPAWTWTGYYFGAHLGAAWQKAKTTGTYIDDGDVIVPFTNSTSATGFVGGGQIGYNWQSGMFVYGVEADISGLSSSKKSASQVVGTPNDTATVTSENRIKWLGTVRGRVGAVVANNTLLYATGGFAYGGVQSKHTELDRSQSDFAIWVDDSTRTGYAVGGGIEHMVMRNVTLRLEGIYVDLGKETVVTSAGTCENSCAPVTFSNKATMVRGGVNVKF